MKRFIASLLLFTVFTLAFYIAGLLFAPAALKKNLGYTKGSYGHLFTRIKDIPAAKNVAVLFLGSSHAYRGFDTRIFDSAGITAFNLGSSAQTPAQTKLLLDKYLSSLQPATIVYEVDPMTLSSDGVESSLDLIANDNITMATVKMATEMHNIKTLNTLVYGLFRQWLGLDKNFKENTIVKKDTYVKGGFVERQMEYFHHEKIAPEKIIFLQDQIDRFGETLDYISGKGIKIILVQAPVTSALYNSKTNNFQFDSIISTKKLPYYNFNTILHLDDSLHFYDSHHLNQNGVQIFNQKLIEMIKK